MAVGGAPLDIMDFYGTLPKASLKDAGNTNVHQSMVNWMLVNIYYRIGADILVNGKATHDANGRAKKDFCDGPRGAQFFR